MGTMMAIGMASTAMTLYGENRALEAQGRASAQTARNYITSMNFSLQNLEQERADAFDATVADLQKIRLQGTRQVKSVEAAINEGLAGGGRTADMLKRSAQADVNRAVWSSKDNYARKSNEIDLNKEHTLRGTQTQISGIQRVKKPSFMNTLLRFGISYMGASQTQEAISAIRGQAGVMGAGGGRTAMQDMTQQTMLSNMNMYTDYKANAINKVMNVETDWLASPKSPYTFQNPYTSNSFKPYF